MPGITLARRGAVRHCQGTLLVDWEMHRDGQVLASGSNVFELLPDGRIGGAVGLPHAGPRT